MRRFGVSALGVAFAGLMGLLGVAGCGPGTPAQKAKVDVSQGEEKLKEAGEERGLQAATSDDLNKMTEEAAPDKLFDEAIAKFTKAIETDPESADAYLQRGVAYFANGKPTEAIRDLSQAIKFNPKLAQAYELRAQAYESQGEVAKSKADLAALAELQGEDPQE